MNGAAKHLLEETLRIASPANLSQIVANGSVEALRAAIAKSRKDQSVEAVDCRLNARGERTVHVSMRVFFSSEGLTAWVKDLTPEEEREKERSSILQQLQQSQKMEAIGVLAAGIAHDFNNILTAISGYVDLARMDLGDPKPRNYIEKALQACGRAKQLVAQILTFGRKTSAADTLILSFSSAVEEAVRFLRPLIPSSIAIDLSVSDNSCFVRANAIEIQQIILNLCTNAAHAIGANPGRITIAVQRAGSLLPPDIRNRNNPHGWVQLVISDSGPGIARDHLRKVFDPYFTTKTKSSGTGLGLSVVSGIVRSYEGSVRVDSDPGNGARFEIFLPCVDPATAERDNRDQAEASPSGGTEFILIVDDEPAVIDVARQLLTRRGYRVVARSNAREALALLRSRPDDIDLVITDLTMPGISGIELARELKSWRADLPVILCSGYDADARRGDGIRPADCLIKKPFNIKELDVAIRRLLSERNQKKAAMHEISMAK